MGDPIDRDEAIKVIYDYCFAPKDVIESEMNAIPAIDRPQKVIAQITLDEGKLREIVKDAIECFKEEYGITDRPTGEWIGEADGYADGELVYDTWYCSNCDYVVDDDEPPTWNYCPNCGSRNRLRNEDERISDD